MKTSKPEITDEQHALISKAIADPSRYRILQQVAGAEVSPTCSCLTEATGLAPATISHHLKELVEAGLLEARRRGKFVELELRRDVWKAYLQRLATLT